MERLPGPSIEVVSTLEVYGPTIFEEWRVGSSHGFWAIISHTLRSKESLLKVQGHRHEVYWLSSGSGLGFKVQVGQG